MAWHAVRGILIHLPGKEYIMSSSIGGIGSSGAMMMQGVRRPDPAQMANDLFSKLDSSGQGYIQKSDLQSAFDKISSSSSSSSTASNVDELFAKLDGDGNGKVTKEEFIDTLKKVADELDSQFANMRMNGGVQGGGKGGMSPGSMGGMPPPPPGGDSGGMTKAQLTSAANETSSSNSEASSSLSKLVNNFDEADTDGDGKISFMEAMKYDQKTSSADSSSSSSSSSASSSSDLNAQLMSQIMKLLQAYGAGNDQSSSLLSTLSVSV
jgi:Ca2+-binding EF-hand superfamily protein